MKIILITIMLAVMLVFPSITSSDSTLGKLIIIVKAEKTPLSVREHPIIVGTITDEASKPISNVKVKITFAKEVITTTTDSNGNFRYESAKPSSPGNYMINIVATKDGYGTGLGSSSYFVNAAPPITYSKGTKGAPIVVGNYTVYIGKVTEWNLESTCFVAFGEQYKRFLKTCDLYNMAPDDFKKPTKMISVLSVVKYDNDYRLFPISVYYDAYKQTEDIRLSHITSTWKNYTTPN